MLEERFRDLETRAEAARAAGRQAEAVALYRGAIGAEVAAGRLEGAIGLFQRIVLARPEDVTLHADLAELIAQAPETPPAGGAPQALFSGVPAREAAELLGRMTPRRCSAGETIVREGDAGTSLFLIASGSVRVTTGGPAGAVELARLAAGDFFGEVSLLTSRPRTATVTAQTDCALFELSREAVADLRRRFPDIDATLSEFHRRRAERTVEALRERMHPRP